MLARPLSFAAKVANLMATWHVPSSVSWEGYVTQRVPAGFGTSMPRHSKSQMLSGIASATLVRSQPPRSQMLLFPGPTSSSFPPQSSRQSPSSSTWSQSSSAARWRICAHSNCPRVPCEPRSRVAHALTRTLTLFGLQARSDLLKNPTSNVEMIQTSPVCRSEAISNAERGDTLT